jgi:predicted molibdopterin-dependent oxidoreductase YjgC
MTAQAELLATDTLQQIDTTWIIAMPKWAADLFGVSEGSLVTLFARPGSVFASMNLVEQTSEARKREPGWFLEMPPAMAKTIGAADGSFIAIYAKNGSLYVEILPSPSPELEASVDRVLNKYGEAFEGLKRLGD